MGGNAIDDGRKLTSSSNEVQTMVLVGRTGNGKSATGNSILGRKAFESRTSPSGVVTKTSEMQKTVLRDGQIVNVIDTPGLFDSSVGPEFVGKEIIKCLDLAKDGIHAILIVFSIRTRFSQEEEAALRTLQTLFGNKIVDYMIVVFTGGDELEENDETLEDYLGRECPDLLKEILGLCKNRQVLFDNKTKDERKKFKQVQQLLSLVSMVISQNGGQPYTDKLFTELKVEPKLMEATKKLEQQLAEEHAARLEEEKNAMLVQSRLDNEIWKLKKDIKKANKQLENNQLTRRFRCAIL